jgi:peptidyl-dipeptidase A
MTALLTAALMLSACQQLSTSPGPDEARRFLDEVNETMKRLGIAASQAGWIAQNYITDDTEALDARATQEYTDAVARFAKAATRFDGVELPPAERRQLDRLKLSLEMVTPGDPKEAEELTQLVPACVVSTARASGVATRTNLIRA